MKPGTFTNAKPSGRPTDPPVLATDPPALPSTHRSAFLRMARVNLLLGGVVFVAWLVLGGDRSLQAVVDHWQVSLTMVLGSLVGGGTSEGGGAVAFPVLTKVLAVPADQARLFSFAIQSVGMTAASITIIANRVPHRVARAALRRSGGGGRRGAVRAC